MTTPAQDAPLVFPSVAFRPVRLLAICCALTALAVGLAAMAGHVMFGVFFGVGLALGAASTIFFDPRYTGGVMLAAIVVAVVVTLIPLLHRPEGDYDEIYDGE